ncbi:hypothetical protein [uncultured Tateyamaria sp.]|nr:hypothetical protein [uncultured Tateyamaria sp.]
MACSCLDGSDIAGFIGFFKGATAKGPAMAAGPFRVVVNFYAA